MQFLCFVQPLPIVVIQHEDQIQLRTAAVPRTVITLFVGAHILHGGYLTYCFIATDSYGTQYAQQ